MSHSIFENKVYIGSVFPLTHSEIGDNGSVAPQLQVPPLNSDFALFKVIKCGCDVFALYDDRQNLLDHDLVPFQSDIPVDDLDLLFFEALPPLIGPYGQSPLLALLLAKAFF
jgi:hypothetical protein